jgi:hypothetical protein
MRKPVLTPDIDYYIAPDGNMVFTEKYLLQRGHCCQSGCLHCPYQFQRPIDPNIPLEFQDAWGTSENTGLDEFDEDENENL